MADSKTTRNPSPAIWGGLLNSGSGYKTTITTDGGKKYTGYGSTAGESQKNASDKAGKGK